MRPIRVFIGFDSREAVALHVLAHSILRHASVPVAITPLVSAQLRHVFTRERGPLESTDFAFTRFLVPWLCGYEGHAIFMDCDMLCRADISRLMLRPLAARPEDKAVFVCPHDYVPRQRIKFLGQIQTAYPRKNWSSLMVFNNAACRALTPEYVNTATGQALHRFEWLDDALIEHLPLTWNWLIGEYEPNPSADILHWTNGGPWFDEYRTADHAEEWFLAREAMLSAATVPLQAA